MHTSFKFQLLSMCEPLASAMFNVSIFVVYVQSVIVVYSSTKERNVPSEFALDSEKQQNDPLLSPP